MKILILCNHGNVRSVGLKYLIQRLYNHDVLAAGVEENSRETLSMLQHWANYLIFLTPESKKYFSTEGKKVAYINIGDDVWHNPFAQELQHLLLKRIKNLDL